MLDDVVGNDAADCATNGIAQNVHAERDKDVLHVRTSLPKRRLAACGGSAVATL